VSLFIREFISSPAIMPPAVFWAVFFKGANFPQKLAPKTSIETQYNLFQVYVSFYILKISPGLFVWATPPLGAGEIIKNRKETV
jgi:hypothetical protein